jgi:Domain of unknown function (DUF5615)
LNIKLYMDEDAMAAKVVAGMRSRGVDVLTAKLAGMLTRDDEDHLAFGAAGNRTLYSFNQGHFLRLHTEWISSGRDHAGVILAKQKRYSPREQIRRLSRLVETLSAEDMQNRVEFLSGW